MPLPYSNSFVAISRAAWVLTVSDETWGARALAIDGNNGTQWNTTNTFPQWMVIDMAAPQLFDRITILVRQDGFQDRPGSIEVYVSTDGSTWGTPVYTQSGLPNDNTLKTFGPFPGGAVTKRYIKYQVLSEAAGARQFTSVAELNAGSVVPIYIMTSKIGPRIINTGKGAKHQRVVAPETTALVPGPSGFVG